MNERAQLPQKIEKSNILWPEKKKLRDVYFDTKQAIFSKETDLTRRRFKGSRKVYSKNIELQISANEMRPMNNKSDLLLKNGKTQTPSPVNLNESDKREMESRKKVVFEVAGKNDADKQAFQEIES